MLGFAQRCTTNCPLDFLPVTVKLVFYPEKTIESLSMLKVKQAMKY